MGHQPTNLTGRARVKLKSGAVYRGLVMYDGRGVTIEGRRVVVSMVDGESVATYRPPGRRTVPLRAVETIVWEETDPEQA